jgi:hypothetical protein
MCSRELQDLYARIYFQTRIRSPKADISLIVDHAVGDYEWDDKYPLS